MSDKGKVHNNDDTNKIKISSNNSTRRSSITLPSQQQRLTKSIPLGGTKHLTTQIPKQQTNLKNAFTTNPYNEKQSREDIINSIQENKRKKRYEQLLAVKHKISNNFVKHDSDDLTTASDETKVVNNTYKEKYKNLYAKDNSHTQQNVIHDPPSRIHYSSSVNSRLRAIANRRSSIGSTIYSQNDDNASIHSKNSISTINTTGSKIYLIDNPPELLTRGENDSDDIDDTSSLDAIVADEDESNDNYINQNQNGMNKSISLITPNTNFTGSSNILLNNHHNSSGEITILSSLQQKLNEEITSNNTIIHNTREDEDDDYRECLSQNESDSSTCSMTTKGHDDNLYNDTFVNNNANFNSNSVISDPSTFSMTTKGRDDIFGHTNANFNSYSVISDPSTCSMTTKCHDDTFGHTNANFNNNSVISDPSICSMTTKCHDDIFGHTNANLSNNSVISNKAESIIDECDPKNRRHSCIAFGFDVSNDEENYSNDINGDEITNDKRQLKTEGNIQVNLQYFQQQSNRRHSSGTFDASGSIISSSINTTLNGARFSNQSVISYNTAQTTATRSRLRAIPIRRLKRLSNTTGTSNTTTNGTNIGQQQQSTFSPSSTTSFSNTANQYLFSGDYGLKYKQSDLDIISSLD